jgi:hypothetical protein
VNGLRTARVLVVDDNPLEAIPVLVTLGRVGIGCIYVRGNRMEDLPAEPLEGIRAVFLDMDLGVGAGGDAKQTVSSTVAVLGRLLGTDASPTVIFVWTKHADLVTPFREAAGRELPNIRPGLVLPIEKWFDYEKEEWPHDSQANEGLHKTIDQAVRSVEPLDVVWLWEQLVHDAASRTTASVSKLASSRAGPHDATATAADNTKRWLEGLKYVLAILARAAGREPHDKDHAFSDLLEVMSLVHHDKVQQGASSLATRDLGVGDQRPTEAEQTHFNTTLLIEPVAPGDLVVRPGNVYIARPEAGNKCPLRRLGLGADGLLKDLLNLDAHAEYRKLKQEYDQLSGKPGAEKEVAESQKKLDAKFAEIRNLCTPILLEVTPACDFAQGKRRTARFLAGMLIPSALTKQVKPSPAVSLEAVTNLEVAGTWHVVVDPRYLFGIPDPDQELGSKPLCRVRHHVLVDIQSKLASHSARPGYISLH